MEDSKKNLLLQAFFSYFVSKTKPITVKQLKQTEHNTEMLFLRYTRGHFEKCLKNNTLKAPRVNENSEAGYIFDTKSPKPVEDKRILWVPHPSGGDQVPFPAQKLLTNTKLEMSVSKNSTEFQA